MTLNAGPSPFLLTRSASHCCCSSRGGSLARPASNLAAMLTRTSNPGTLLFLIFTSGRKGRLQEYPVPKIMWSTFCTEVPSIKCTVR
ncbi:hypothetical protein KCU59_g171, partial [Aureobasidium melanogenum]